MDFKYLILRQFRSQLFNKSLNIRNLSTQQNLNSFKRIYLKESRCLLDKPKSIDLSIRNSQSYLPRRKRGYVWQGRKEDTDYDRSGLLLAFYYNVFLVLVLFIFYYKKRLFD